LKKSSIFGENINRMNTKNLLIALFCLLALNFQAIRAKDPDALKKFLSKKELAHAAVSLKAVDLATGKVIVSHNENMSLTPASNMKLVTTATAIETLGDSFRYETPIVYDGYIRNDTLFGDIFVKGVGDPSLGSEYVGDGPDALFEAWSKSVTDAGIRYIEGDVVVLDQLFGYEGVSPKWMLEDLGWYYGSPIYGVSVFDNMCRIYLKSGPAGGKPEVLRVKPYIDNLEIVNQLTVTDSTVNSSEIFGYPFANERFLKGAVAAGRENIVFEGDIPDPGAVLADYFYKSLLLKGVKIAGKATTFRVAQVLPKTEKPLYVHRSPDLRTLVREINLHSNNNFTEYFFKLLRQSYNLNIPEYWTSKGLDASALQMYDGSGLSPINAVSSGFLIELLIYMDKKYGRDGAYFQSLPVAGKEGTVASFLRNTPLAGKAHLKSGSITGVQSFSGYVEIGSKRYAVSFLVNNFSGKRTDLRKAMEELLVRLF